MRTIFSPVPRVMSLLPPRAAHLRRAALLLLLLLLLACDSLTASAAPRMPPEQGWPPETLPLLPVFLLPYDSSVDTVVWSGGPHAYNGGGDLDGKYAYGEGSGLDFAAQEGGSFTVLAMAAGQVIKSGCGYEGLGCIVAVQHDEGSSVLIYAHLQEEGMIGAGVHVVQGTVLGQAGDSGGQPSVHLHIELRDGGACDSSLHAQCGDIGWAGNPVGWERGLLFVDGYRISGYCAAQGEAAANCFELPSVRYYAYEGAAFRGGATTTDYNFWFNDIDEHNVRRRVRAAVVVDPSFVCTSQRDCERYHESRNMLFAGHGRFGTGGGPNIGDELESTNRAIAAPAPTSAVEQEVAQIAIQRGAGLFLLDRSTGVERPILEVEEQRGAQSPLQLSWSADGSRLAFATAAGDGATVTILELDALGSATDWFELGFAGSALPLVAFDPAERDRLFYAAPTADDPSRVDLFAYSISTGIEELLYTTPVLGPCTATKLLALAADRFILLHTCGTGAGNEYSALEVNHRAGTFEAAWLDDWVLGYWFLDQPAECAEQSPQVIDAAWQPATSTLAYLLSPDCFDALYGGTWSGSEEVALLDLARPSPRAEHLLASSGITAIDFAGGGAAMLYRTDDGNLWQQPADGAARQLVAGDVDAAAARPAGSAPGSTALASSDATIENLSFSADAQASSSLPSDRYGSYGPAQAVDGSAATAWSEGVEGDGVGEFLQLDFPAPVQIDYLEILNGYAADAASFAANNRAAAVTITFDDGRSFTLLLDDLPDMQRFDQWSAGQGTVTSSLRLTIDAVYPGTRFDDTCLAELRVWGTRMDD